MLIRSLAALLVAVASPTPAPSPAPLPTMPTLTVTATPETVQISLPLPPDARIEERTTSTEWRLAIPGWRPTEPNAVVPPVGTTGIYGLNDPVLGTLTARIDEDGASLVLPWKYWCPSAIDWLDEPRRLVVTLRKVYTVTVPEDVAAGVRHDHVRMANAQGPLDVHVLRLDPGARLKVAPALAKDAFTGREPVSAIVRRYGAVAGINGGYFSPRTGEPLGLVMIDGEVVAGPMFNRSILALGGVQPEIGRTQLATRLVLPSGESYDFDGVNQPRGLNRMVLYTARFGASTFTPTDQAGASEYTLLGDGTVLSAVPGNAPIPPGGTVISAHGQAAEWLAKRVKPGDKLAVRSALAEQWPGARHVLGGGPTLLDDGEVRLTTEQEQFKPDIAVGRAPRTAVGITPEGGLLLVTVDGRNPRASVGLTLEGMARLMKQLGARDAINFDGGGSTAMALGGVGVLNHPSDGQERSVNTALLVWPAAQQQGAR